jgi:hypothetical protein
MRLLCIVRLRQKGVMADPGLGVWPSSLGQLGLGRLCLR